MAQVAPSPPQSTVIVIFYAARDDLRRDTLQPSVCRPSLLDFRGREKYPFQESVVLFFWLGWWQFDPLCFVSNRNDSREGATLFYTRARNNNKKFWVWKQTSLGVQTNLRPTLVEREKKNKRRKTGNWQIGSSFEYYMSLGWDQHRDTANLSVLNSFSSWFSHFSRCQTCYLFFFSPQPDSSLINYAGSLSNWNRKLEIEAGKISFQIPDKETGELRNKTKKNKKRDSRDSSVGRRTANGLLKTLTFLTA